MPTPRPSPYVWISWLTRLLAGEACCEWAAWFKAHYRDYVRAADTFDPTGWQIEHAALLRRTRDGLLRAGYRVRVESENAFVLNGSCGSLAGKPDLIATRDVGGERTGLVVDTKTGRPKAADRVQVLTYLWAVPKAFGEFRRVRFDGRVVYANGEAVIAAGDLTESFVANLRSLIRSVCGQAPPPKAPSYGECRFCSIGEGDCAERVKGEAGGGVETDAF